MWALKLDARVLILIRLMDQREKKKKSTCEEGGPARGTLGLDIVLLQDNSVLRQTLNRNILFVSSWQEKVGV